MFGENLKTKIELLEKQKKSLEADVETLKAQLKKANDKLFIVEAKLNYPPKFKKGDKFGKLMVIDVNYYQPTAKEILSNPEIAKWLAVRLVYFSRKSKPKGYYDTPPNIKGWRYQLVHLSTAELSELSEAELIEKLNSVSK